MTKRRPAIDRILSRCVAGPNGCVIFVGPRNPKGYGSINEYGRTRRVHRVAYEVLVGPIPAGMLVCHSCDNPPCVNPDHLWLGTANDNNQDRKAKNRYALKDACPQGHKYTAENTHLRSDGGRTCRACRRERWHQKKARAL